jgi:predicted nucleic acid-binding protein
MIAGMRSLFVDTSGWIEVFGRDNPLHKKARGIVDRAVKERRPIITTNYVITEFVARGCDKCHLTRERLFDAIDKISKWPGIEIVHIGEESHAVAITLLRNRLDKKWSLVDATSINLMQARRIHEALTTDHHFEQAQLIKLL